MLALLWILKLVSTTNFVQEVKNWWHRLFKIYQNDVWTLYLEKKKMNSWTSYIAQSVHLLSWWHCISWPVQCKSWCILTIGFLIAPVQYTSLLTWYHLNPCWGRTGSSAEGAHDVFPTMTGSRRQTSSLLLQFRPWGTTLLIFTLTQTSAYLC